MQKKLPPLGLRKNSPPQITNPLWQKKIAPLPLAPKKIMPPPILAPLKKFAPPPQTNPKNFAPPPREPPSPYW